MQYLNGNIINKSTDVEELGLCIGKEVILQGAIYKMRIMKGDCICSS